MTVFQIVTNRASESQQFETDDPLAAFEVRGYRFTKLSSNHADADPRSAVPRKELWDQPEFDGLCGPMWGGHDDKGRPILRYEDWETYDLLTR
jgi:hypothetical protein